MCGLLGGLKEKRGQEREEGRGGLERWRRERRGGRLVRIKKKHRQEIVGVCKGGRVNGVQSLSKRGVGVKSMGGRGVRKRTKRRRTRRRRTRRRRTSCRRTQTTHTKNWFSSITLAYGCVSFKTPTDIPFVD